jgi:FKBP-type peptidyl-prolyl cis-trans isomerase SlpA
MIGPNKLVSVHVTLKLEDGTIIYTTRDNIPYKYISNKTHSGTVFQNLLVEISSIGEVGGIYNFVLKNLFGEYDYNRVIIMPTHQFPAGPKRPSVGDTFLLHSDRLGEMYFTVKSIEGDKAILDGNHPYASHVINYEIEIVDIIDLN